MLASRKQRLPLEMSLVGARMIKTLGDSRYGEVESPLTKNALKHVQLICMPDPCTHTANTKIVEYRGFYGVTFKVGLHRFPKSD